MQHETELRDIFIQIKNIPVVDVEYTEETYHVVLCVACS